MKDRTIWSNPEQKLKPRNMQAVRIIMPAKGFNQPPPEQKPPRFEPTFEQRLKEESKHRRARIVELEKAAALRAIEIAQNSKIRKEKHASARNKATYKNMWLVKYEKRMAKSLGKPIPSNAELKQKRKSLPTTGKPLFSKP